VSKSRTKTARLNLRIPSDLLKWIKKHAKDTGTTVTKIVVLHFMNTKSGEQLKVGHNPFAFVDKEFPPHTHKEASSG
jgi:hypothetical protein